MKEYAYKKLCEAVTKGELENFLTSSTDYVVANNDRNTRWSIDYYSMAFAINKFLTENPSYIELFRNAFLSILSAKKSGYIYNVAELVAAQLRFWPDNELYLNDVLLTNFKYELNNVKDTFSVDRNKDLQNLDKLSYVSSGKHIL